MRTAEAGGTDGLPESPGPAWAPIRHRVFAEMWSAQFVSNVGGWMQTVGAQWLMLTLTEFCDLRRARPNRGKPSAPRSRRDGPAVRAVRAPGTDLVASWGVILRARSAANGCEAMSEGLDESSVDGEVGPGDVRGALAGEEHD